MSAIWSAVHCGVVLGVYGFMWSEVMCLDSYLDLFNHFQHIFTHSHTSTLSSAQLIQRRSGGRGGGGGGGAVVHANGVSRLLASPGSEGEGGNGGGGDRGGTGVSTFPSGVSVAMTRRGGGSEGTGGDGDSGGEGGVERTRGDELDRL